MRGFGISANISKSEPMNITVLAVDRLRNKNCRSMAEDYLKRCSKFVRVDMREVKSGRAENAELTRKKEAASLLESIRPDDRVVVCDEHGENWTTKALADYFDAFSRAGRTGRLMFVIGGPEGLDKAVRKRSDVQLSFGRITLPHELARVVLLEQIYRAWTILRNHPYHRDNDNS